MFNQRGKKAQITVFIIIAIVIAFAIGGYYLVQNIQTGPAFEDFNFENQIGIVKETLQDCSEIVYKDSLDFIGAQGGYYGEPFEYYVGEGDLYLPIYSYNGENTIPSKELIEEEISSASIRGLDICLYLIEQQFSAINLEYDDYSIEANILQKTVKIKTTIDITLNSIDGASTAQIAVDDLEIPSKLNDMILAADYYISSQSVDRDFICMNCISEIAENFGLIIEIVNYDQDIILINIFSDDVKTYPALYKFLEVYIPQDEDLLLPIIETNTQNQNEFEDNSQDESQDNSQDDEIPQIPI